MKFPMNQGQTTIAWPRQVHLRPLRPVAFSQAVAQVSDGDLLLFRRVGIVARAGRGVHSHAAMAAWWDTELFLLEVTPRYGGRAVRLAAAVEKYPGRIDLFRADPEGHYPHFDRRGAVQAMQRLMGQPYGWGRLMGIVLRRLPLLRLVLPTATAGETPVHQAAFCSEAVAWAARVGGGVDPVPHLADRFTEPADLARSLFHRYWLTFVPG